MTNPADETPPSDIKRHNMKMARKKQARDKIMASKTGEKGLIIVHTGKGKGKSSSAFGMVFRCIAHGLKTGVVQFIKGGMDTGERNLITTHFGDLCDFHTMGEGFTWETQDRERDVAAAMAAWEKAKELIRNPAYHMVLLDETYGNVYRDKTQKIKTKTTTDETSAVGYKIMYNQGPTHYGKDLMARLDERGIKVVHLIRSNKLLQYISFESNEKDKHLMADRQKAAEEEAQEELKGQRRSHR